MERYTKAIIVILVLAGLYGLSVISQMLMLAGLFLAIVVALVSTEGTIFKRNKEKKKE